ncbi:MAG: hypothetical protein IPG90_03070 [Bacteroidetes bacterium]|nr:hypothetical protein [Bacteroidota bacterium]MBL0259152.1 hypothetical protein [Bacteroidota bacterium]
MKKGKMLFFSVAVTGLMLSGQSFAQEKKVETEHTEKTEKTVSAVQEEAWQERTDFHKVMSTTFHPMEDGDFKPIRERAAEMHAKAEAWAKSTAPKSFDKPEIKEKLQMLVTQSSELKDRIAAKATDEEVKTKLTALHETFHQIAGLCKPGM